MRRYLKTIIYGFILVLLSTVVTFAAATFYVQTIRVPDCADLVTNAILYKADRFAAYDNCLTDGFKSRYPNRETWVEDFGTNRRIPEAPGPAEVAFAQQDRANHWAIIYITVVPTEIGQRPYTISIFTKNGLVDYVLA